jgi:pyridoxine kinase
MSILSIQSHVAYGFVGNKAAIYPLQNMGQDVWPINTVQFSNHTGYAKWQGEVFSGQHIWQVTQGLIDIGVVSQCKAILSGYLASADIGQTVNKIVKEFKKINDDIVYLCDPVIGDNHCYVKQEVMDFFRVNLSADIITPNQFEAEALSNIQIKDLNDLARVAQFFHNKNIKIVVITGIKLFEDNLLSTFISYDKEKYIINTRRIDFQSPINGTGDLFSAVFLGSYVQNKNPKLALQHSVYYLDKVLQNTYTFSKKELQVLSTNYALDDLDLSEHKLINISSF